MPCPYNCEDKFKDNESGTRGKARARQSGGKPPQSKMGLVRMWRTMHKKMAGHFCAGHFLVVETCWR